MFEFKYNELIQQTGINYQLSFDHKNAYEMTFKPKKSNNDFNWLYDVSKSCSCLVKSNPNDPVYSGCYRWVEIKHEDDFDKYELYSESCKDQIIQNLKDIEFKKKN